ncbi:hypothetical protein CANCADRAFT_49013 [Tortispora caseinolytica NRRL Y-17796]|uniref:K Homology domain-containing protein n=1 Tax=Tortispora caseinolytica NRRL Y-17796 TaxID=767744 RepID=A0A1E4TLY2_9ASCO|nr:hypothetical protein CANCADRAFT_49013 [Tortispora caseinolytica NRRL Y-17796]
MALSPFPSSPAVGQRTLRTTSSIAPPLPSAVSTDPDFTADQYQQVQLTLRAVVSSKEAGVIIGKAGRTVASLRDATGVKAGVSKPIPGVHDRILTVSGHINAIAEAYAMIADFLINASPSDYSSLSTPGTATIRLLISHNQMGTIIGRQGAKIKSIQESCKVRMTASKEMLDQSTERVVEVQGATDGMRAAIWEIAKCLVDDWQHAAGTVFYQPGTRSSKVSSSANGATASSSSAANRNSPNGSSDAEEEPELETQNISIPDSMVGCLIGRGGSKIQTIRRLSNARISIPRHPQDDSGNRVFSIVGTGSAIDKAIYLLYEQLEIERLRRQEEQQQQQSAQQQPQQAETTDSS